jgi:hypothetical protein
VWPLPSAIGPHPPRILTVELRAARSICALAIGLLQKLGLMHGLLKSTLPREHKGNRVKDKSAALRTKFD